MSRSGGAHGRALSPRRALAALAFLACAVLAGTPAMAAAWRTAALWGGDVRSLAVHPANPDLVFAGTANGHVYQSRDGGASWTEAAPGLPLRGWVIGTLLFDPNGGGGGGDGQPPRLWVALWGIWGGGTVLLSEDLGATWVPRHDGLPEEQIYALAAVPGRRGSFFAAARSGVWGTDDDGKSWRHLTADHPEVHNVSSLLVDPHQPERLLAGTWRRAYRSDDSGRTWRGVFEGMVLDSEVFSLQPEVKAPGEVWASTCGWVYRTQDFGESWTRFQKGMTERRTPTLRVLFDGRLLAGTVAGLFSSDDRGQSWQRRTGGELSVLAIATHPQRPERVWIGTEGAGVWASQDGGTTFMPSPLGMTNVRVTALARAGQEVLAAVAHAGPGNGVHTSRDGGLSFDPLPLPLPTVLELAVAATPLGHEVFAATERGLWRRRAGGPFERVAELGDQRVEQVAVRGERVVARTASGLFERRSATAAGAAGRDSFTPVSYQHGAPRALAIADDALWVSDDAGLYRLAGGTNHAVSAPFKPAGGLESLGSRLLITGSGGAWVREIGEDLRGSWSPLRDGAVRGLATGDRHHPVLLVGKEDAQLLETATRSLRPIELPIAARDVSSALVVDGRLLVGTSGYGLLVMDLE